MKRILNLMLVLLMMACFAMSLGEEQTSLAGIKEQDLTLKIGSRKTLTLGFDKSVKKNGAVMRWSSEDETVAEVSGKGTVTAVAPGKTKISCWITLKSGAELQAETAVEVVRPVEKITLIPEKQILIGLGTEVKPECIVEPEDATNIGMVWSSSDEAVAAVDPDGTIHGLQAGKARITAEAADGFGVSAALEVQVTPLFSEVSEAVIEKPQGTQVRVHYDREKNFDEDYKITLEGEEVSWTAEAEEGIAILSLKPLAAAEEKRLIIQGRQNAQERIELPVRVEESAICNAQKMCITKAELLSGTGALTYRLELKNNSAEEIGEIGFLVDYRDQFGDTRYLFSNSDGTIQNYSYVTRFNVKPGETRPLVGRTEAFRSDDAITEVRVTVNYYRYVESGEKVYIPDSQLYWFSSKTGEMDRPEETGPYRAPDTETTDKADQITYNFRATLCDLYTYVVKPFSRSYYPGKFVAIVGDGGWAKLWGLRTGDVIYGAEDLLWVNDPFFLNRVFARVCDGETVNLKVVRNGREIEIPIAAGDEMD